MGDRVNEVRSSKRLVGSPAIVLESDQFMTASMRRILKSMQPEGAAPPPKPDLEINPRHPIIARLEKMRHADAALAGTVSAQLLDNARLAAGLLEDPRTMLTRLNELLQQVLKGKGE